MTADGPLRPLPAQLEVVPLVDPVVEGVGHYPLSVYVESCWLPILGPSTTFLYRRLGLWICQSPEGLAVDTVDLAVSIGLGQGTGRNSMLARSVGRLVSFYAAEWQEDRLAVRRVLPPLTERQAGKLSASAFAAHQAMSRRVS